VSYEVLVACEFSGTVRDAFRAEGFATVSNDLLPTEAEGPHIQGDCVDVIKSQQWKLIVMHPPCTALAMSGNSTYGVGKPKHHERLASIEWTMGLFELAQQHAPYVCMENPVGMLPRMADQYVQPWQFGHGETKKVGLWLVGLPWLDPTDIVEGREQRVQMMPPSPDRGKKRSIFFPGIARAMARQWGPIIRRA